MTFDEYCNSIGISSSVPYAEDLHKTSKNVSAIAKKRALAKLAQEFLEWQKQRERARNEYTYLVSIGTIKPVDRLEFLKIVASGHPDNVATQAAIRLLAKRKEKDV